MGVVRFGIPQQLVLWARDTFGARRFVETGTNRAVTAVWAAEHFAHVITIEGQRELYEANVNAYGHRTNLTFLVGDSRKQLAPALASFDGPAVIWLDAHWCGEGTFGVTTQCPVIEEVAAVNRSHPGHVILIDDARFFTATPNRACRATDWPGFLEVAAALSCGPTPRYAVILEDVIVAVPAAGRDTLNEYVRSANDAASKPVAKPLWRRSLNRIARAISS